MPDWGRPTESKHEYRGYCFIIQRESGLSTYVVDFPDIPEIITSGSTLAEAFSNACEALDLHLESLQKLGRQFPPARHRLVVNVA